MSDVIARALAGNAGSVLHRVTADDGLEQLVGRDAVLARLRAVAGGPIERAIGHGNHALLVTGNAHIWAGLEAGRIAAVTIIASRAADPRTAATLAGAHPCHRPLGELASGRGQLPPLAGDGPIDRLVHNFASRASAVLAAGLAPLFGAVPDALLLPCVHLPLPDGGQAGLCRLLGHADGRRISLPVSLLVTASGCLQAMMHDPLALAAAPLRPFWPE